MRASRRVRAAVGGLVALMVAVIPAVARQPIADADRTRVDVPRASVRPLAEALDADGTVAPTARGSFDATGYRLRRAPGGAPRFVAATADDDAWKDVFSSPGTDDIIRAVAVRGSEVFVGGQFATIGKAAANNVARWNGSTWTSLGEGAENGVDGPVYSFAVTPTAVFVGGSFRHAGTVGASNVARWDGTSWSSLGDGNANGVSGFGNIVYAIVADAGVVYVGGLFTTAGDVPAASLAKYDEATTTWSEFGGVANEDPEDPVQVYALALTKKDIFVGGKFTRAAGVPANYIARYSRKPGTWSGLGSGMDNWVTALAVKGRTVYAGGFFSTAGGAPAYGVAKWNGASWSALGDGLSTDGYDPGAGYRVKGLALVKSRLYVAGYFTDADGVDVGSVSEWRGGVWRSLAGGLKGGIRLPQLGDAFGLAAGPAGVVVAGVFNTAGDTRAFQVARWSAAGWTTVADAGPHEGVYDGLIGAVAVDGANVYVGGFDMIVGGVTAYGVARWDGASWSTLGEGDENGVNGYVNAIVVEPGGAVLVGGLFSRAGTTTAINVARWTGSAWRDLGVGVGGSPDSQVFAIAVDGTDVYVGGIFPYAGEPAIEVGNVAKWDGAAWSSVGGGIPTGPVLALAARGGTLYAGGFFAEAGGVAANSVARWDGGRWNALGAGIDGAALAMVLDESGRLIVGGEFTTAGGAPASRLAAWDGASWSEVGGGLTPGPDGFGYATTLALDLRGRLVVGGLFVEAGGVPANNIARLDGTTWSTFGSGTNDVVLGATANGGSVYVAGAFSRAGGKPSVRFAQWEGIDF